MSNILTVKNLNYNDILKGINFSLKEKTFNILIGENGSGKTTLVKCIRQIINYQGDIEFFGSYKINNNKEIGFFIDEELFLEDTIYEELFNLLINLNYTDKQAKERIFTLIKSFDLVDILFRYNNELNDSQKTVISFIFSIIHNPKLLIIDNTLQKLDKIYEKQILNYLKKYKNTILFITNNNKYFYLADNFFVLREGKILLSFEKEQLEKNENNLIKNGANLPFEMALSNKLISYGLLDNVEYNIEEMVEKIWK